MEKIITGLIVVLTVAACSKPASTVFVQTSMLPYASIPKSGESYDLYGIQPNDEGIDTEIFGPSGFAVDNNGEIWIANAGHTLHDFSPRIYHFDLTGVFIGAVEYPESYIITDFYTKKGNITALAPAPINSQSSVLTLNGLGSIINTQVFPEGYNTSNGYMTLTESDRGPELVQAFGTKYVHVSEDGSPSESSSMEVQGNEYQIMDGIELIINDKPVASHNTENVGGYVLIGVTDTGIFCAADEIGKQNEDGTLNVNTSIQCFNSNGEQTAEVTFPIQDVVSFDRHYVMGEDQNIYVLSATENEVTISRIEL